MHKLGIVFSGQGSQYVGMGNDFIDDQPKYKEMTEQASDILGFNVFEALQSEDLMNQTLYTQPLMILKTLFGYEAIKSLKPNISAVAGFSLGEYAAYYATGIFNFTQILDIVSKRAIYMDEDTKKTLGSMAAIIGLDYETVQNVCTSLSTQGVIQVANLNEYKQYVISGEEKLVQLAIEQLKTLGARRAILLKTSGAFHTPLMQDASKKLVSYIKNNVILSPKQSDINMYMNLDAQVLNEKDIYKHIEKQMTHPVLFIDMIHQMKKDGITHILEIGPGKVLTNLIRKIDDQIEVTNFDHLDSVESVKGWLSTYGFTK